MTSVRLVLIPSMVFLTLLANASDRQAPHEPSEPKAHAHAHPLPHAAPAARHGVATARIEGLGGAGIRGSARFRGDEGEVVLEIEVSGVAPGLHAMHIHEIGDCSAADGSSAGDHWNPGGHDHGHHAHGAGHRGDLGNIEVGPDGTGRFVTRSREWTIGGPADTNVVGKSVIVHASEDDLKSQPGGSAGDRIACGVIRSAR